MASSEEVNAVSGTEVDDGFAEDSKLEKKKKFKPFQKVRNFFRGSSKKRFKGEGDASLKSHSISALHTQDGDEDDDGGFKRVSLGLAGSRSISEDSIFKPEQTKEQPIGVLHGTAVSMERINSDFQSELFSKLKSRQSDSDMDDGLPSSPLSTLTTADVILGGGLKSAPAAGKSTSRESDKSLLSIDGSETEEDLFTSNWKAAVASVKRPSSSGSQSDGGMDVTDLDVVEMRTAKLSNEGAKHRISVKPKSRRASTKTTSMKRKEKPSTTAQLPGVKEESPTKISMEETQDSSIEKKPKISTTIAVGNPPVPRSEPKDIPQSKIPKDEPDTSKPHSMSPLSTSPLSGSILQDVKLRPRPASGKFDSVEPKVADKGEADSELSQAFNKAKRFSKKYEDDVNIDTKKSLAKDVTVNVNVKDKEENKFGISLKGVTNVKEEKKSPSEDKKSPTTENKPITEPSKETVVSPGLTGVSFVLKKEPLRPVNVRQESTEGKTVSASSTEKKDGSVVRSAMKQPETNVSKDITKSDSTTSSKVDSGKVSFGSPEKLASPREDYKLKRQVRSKTLPEQPVPKEILDKAKEADAQKPPLKRLGSPPMSTKVRTSDYDNVSVGPKPIQSKRASWTPETTKSGSVSGEPSWIAKARQKQADYEKQEKEKENKETDAKTEVCKTDEKSSTQTTVKTIEKATPQVNEKSESVPSKTAVSTTAVSEKSNVQTNVKSWTQSYTAKPFEKTNNVSSVKAPSVQSSSITAKSVTEKPVNVQVKPNVSAQTSTKPSVQPVSRPGFDKPPVASVKHTVEKPTPVSAVKTSFDRTGSQKTSSVTAKPAFDSKPVTQSSARPFGSTNTNISKEPVKSVTSVSKEPIKSSVTADTRKPVSVETKKVEEKNDSKLPATSGASTRAGNVFEKKTGTPDAGGIPSWKQKKNSPSQVKIEIIDKTENKSDLKTPERKVEEFQKRGDYMYQKKSLVQSREKTKTDTCSDSAANRQSRVLDMVKNFQKLQVT